MALSEARTGGLQLRRVETVGGSDAVRHVDQLSDREFELLLATLDGSAVSLAEAFEPGEVVVFDDYYRVESA